MMTPDTLLRCRQLVADHFGMGLDAITAETRFGEDLEADSIDRIDLVCAVEDEFDIRVAEDSESGWITVGNVADWIDEDRP